MQFNVHTNLHPHHDHPPAKIIKVMLTSKYPKDPRTLDRRGDPLEKGKDLFDAFRPRLDGIGWHWEWWWVEQPGFHVILASQTFCTNSKLTL